MYDTSYASPDEYADILIYLERVGLPWNSWLTWSIEGAFTGCARSYGILICRSDNAICGVAALAWRNDDKPSDGYMAYLDASDENAFLSLLGRFPEAQNRSLRLFNPDLHKYAESLPGVERIMGELYYTVTDTAFCPVDGPDVVEVTAADHFVFDGFEQNVYWEGMGDSKRYAVIIDGKAVTSAGICPIGPVMPSGKQTFSISGLYTQTSERRKGYGRRLVSFLTEMILSRNGVPMYWTETDNIPSQNLCTSRGYRQYAQEMRCFF